MRNLRLLALACGLTLATGSHATLINGGFEMPDIGNSADNSFELDGDVAGWSTTDSVIEIWANGFRGVTSYEGTQHAEINANINGTLFQEVSGIAIGSIVGFEFAHRARASTGTGIDVMSLTITDLGVDGLLDGVNDTTLFTKEFSADTSGWVFNTSAPFAPIVALGNDIRFAYSAVSTGNNDPSFGNFLDAANFGIGVGGAPVPEPGSLAMAGLGLVGLVIARRRRRGIDTG